jgi:ketosteroid isomerase-like protein
MRLVAGALPVALSFGAVGPAAAECGEVARALTVSQRVVARKGGRKMKTLLLSAAVCALFVPAYAQAQSTDLLKAATDVNAKFWGGPAKVTASVIAENAIFEGLVPKRPLVSGRANIEKVITEIEEKEGAAKWQSATAQAIPMEGGSLAYASGTYGGSRTKPDGTVMPIKGFWIEVLKHEGNEWKILVFTSARE